MTANVASPPDNPAAIPAHAVYLIGAPRTRGTARWVKLAGELAAILAVPLASFEDLAGPLAPDQLAATFTGAVLVPLKAQGRYWIGRRAVAEAEAFGGRCAVYAAGRVIPWPACRLRFPPKHPDWTPGEIILPGSAAVDEKSTGGMSG